MTKNLFENFFVTFFMNINFTVYLKVCEQYSFKYMTKQNANFAKCKICKFFANFDL